jgi:hypothetical protein
MILNGVTILSSDIGLARCDTARSWQDSNPTEDYREVAQRALRRRSGAQAPTNEVRVANFKPAGVNRLKEVERLKEIGPLWQALKAAIWCVAKGSISGSGGLV